VDFGALLTGLLLIGEGMGMTELSHVSKQLDELSCHMETSVAELVEIKRALDGWYDAKDQKHYDGISQSVLDAVRTLASIDGTLDGIRLDARRAESIPDAVRQASQTTDSYVSVIRAGLDALLVRFTFFGILTSAGIIAILGTLRHWF
jgi:hypothetical protein